MRRLPLQTSRRVSLTRGISDSTALIGWFHSVRSHGKRTDDGLPRHFIGIMIEGPSSEGSCFRPAMRTEQEHAYDRGATILPNGRSHRWSLRFDPLGDGRETSIQVSLDDQTIDLKLSEKQQLGTAAFNRFGIITILTDGNYQFVCSHDLEYNASLSTP